MLLPDTRVMVVTYTVSGDEGYVADVQFEGEAQAQAQQYQVSWMGTWVGGLVMALEG